MLAYRLDDLGWFEFEQLVQTLLKAKLGLGIEAWGGHGDWGRDAYFEGTLTYPTSEKTRGPFVFQSKFVEAANAAGAKPESLIGNAVSKECLKIKQHLSPDGDWSDPPSCYALLTNTPLSAKLRKKLEAMLHGVLPGCSVCIHDGHDLCQWLRDSPDIVRSFPQLLSLRDLQELLRESVHAETIVRSQGAIDVAKSYARVFVPTEAYYLARTKLQQHGFVVLEGPPEMGKTTIGRVIALSQVCSGWEAFECRNPSEVLASYRRDRRQVFVADDFFGRTEYEPTRVSEWQSELAHILPLLGASHWLVLTCRAHLLEMAKGNLDIAGQNHRFPEIGEVVVNAGKLKLGEKARILYRHAKAAGLSQSAKSIIKSQAREIAGDAHFTPERIRRLVEELVPSLALDSSISKADLRTRLAEALSNPTKQMRVSFRKLPASHRWLLFALLEADFSSYVIHRHPELEKRYDTLCPSKDILPFKRVLDELTEAFVKKIPDTWTVPIDWIHPSCRDLAIEELADNVRDREVFLSNCDEAGLSLATSVGGGAVGARQLPLLQTPNDWRTFAAQSLRLLPTRPRVLQIVWNNFQALTQKQPAEPGLAEAIKQLRQFIQRELLPTAAKLLGTDGYRESEALKTYFEAVDELEVQVEIDLTEAWNKCVEDAERWQKSPLVIWQNSTTPKAVLSFLSLVSEFQARSFETPEVCKRVEVIASNLATRGEIEVEETFELPDDPDEAVEMVNALDVVSEAFSGITELRCITDATRQRLSKQAEHFREESLSLSEGLPSEPDSDEDRGSRPSAEDVNIGELFQDL